MRRLIRYEYEQLRQMPTSFSERGEKSTESELSDKGDVAREDREGERGEQQLSIRERWWVIMVAVCCSLTKEENEENAIRESVASGGVARGQRCARTSSRGPSKHTA